MSLIRAFELAFVAALALTWGHRVARATPAPPLFGLLALAWDTLLGTLLDVKALAASRRSVRRAREWWCRKTFFILVELYAPRKPLIALSVHRPFSWVRIGRIVLEVYPQMPRERELIHRLEAWREDQSDPVYFDETQGRLLNAECTARRALVGSTHAE